MLHHLPDDLKPLGLAEVRRVLKPGGRFLAVDIQPRVGAFGHELLSHILGDRMAHAGLSDLQPVMAAAGFSGIETGPTRMRLLAFLRGQA